MNGGYLSLRVQAKLCSLQTRNHGPCGRLLPAVISLDL